jgi:hypothetical protein
VRNSRTGKRIAFILEARISGVKATRIGGCYRRRSLTGIHQSIGPGYHRSNP